MYNVDDGLLNPNAQVSRSVNALKKHILNGMIVNLRDEMTLSQNEMAAELEACGKYMAEGVSVEEKIEALASHYAAQRKKSVKALVPPNYWVGPAHLKGMAIHARETVYVLDVHRDNIAWMQEYAYQDMTLPSGDTVESGTVRTMTTSRDMKLLKELISGGVLPVVMILNWQEPGNHFQAVTYDTERYKQYFLNVEKLATKRNEILASVGSRPMDLQPYDTIKMANAAAQELKAIRKTAEQKRGGRPKGAEAKSGAAVNKAGVQDDEPRSASECAEGLNVEREGKGHTQKLQAQRSY
ncbi:hypothetical protein PF010_g28500 [Phytophthora fragariae]|uniref:Uncharacterized protein n=1 Tax=Phytophthora fragariae TaxID=53985 RepID=A0A6G0JRA6_9STRA|nr:hypothetical protein PF010_g28500 [Phytophthora fragariae]